MTESTKKITIITPCFNEEDNVEACAAACARVMQEHLPNFDYEHIFADNASTDDSLTVLRKLAAQDRHVKVIVNSRNIGPFRNMANAMASATGDAVIPMLPADLQDPPDVIPSFVEKWERGALVVYGIRTNRREGVILRTARGLFYRIMTLSGGSKGAPPHAGEFQLLDRRVVDSIVAVDDQYPYIRGLVAQTGVPWDLVEYTWAQRRAGRSKNNLWSLLDQAVNAFVTTARAPSRLALVLGLAASTFGVLFGLVSLVVLAVTRGAVGAGIPTLIVGVFVFGGLQLFFIGLIGEYVLSIHAQVRRGPAMFEIERINFDR
jgi:glycosyltransferase involved in cell wall biosynthesis